MPYYNKDGSKGKIKLNCALCNKVFEEYPSVINHNNQRGSLMYCSTKCSNANRKNIWKYYGKDTNNFKHGNFSYRKLAIMNKGLVCEKCKYDGAEYPSLIWVHHKDFNGRFEERSNDLDNLSVLCIRCHLELHLKNKQDIGGVFHAFSKSETSKMDV